MACYAVTTVQHLYCMGCHTQFQHQANQGMGHAVAVTFEFDVTVNVYTHRFEDRPFPGLLRQNHQSRCIDLGKHAGTAAGQLLKRALVKPLQQRRNRVVDFLYTGELEFTQSRQYPTFHQQYAVFDFRLILWVVGACG